MLSQNDYERFAKEHEEEDDYSSESDGDDLGINTNDLSTKKKNASTKKKTTTSTRPKLDLAKLLSERGFPHLRSHGASLINGLKGTEGSEISDMRDILQFMREWHQLVYPRGRFSDFVRRVEGVARTRPAADYIEALTKEAIANGKRPQAEKVAEDFDVVIPLSSRKEIKTASKNDDVSSTKSDEIDSDDQISDDKSDSEGEGVADEERLPLSDFEMDFDD